MLPQHAVAQRRGRKRRKVYTYLPPNSGMERDTVNVTTERDLREIVEERGGVGIFKPGPDFSAVLFYVNSEGEYKQRFESGEYLEHEPENSFRTDGESVEIPLAVPEEDDPSQPFKDGL